MFNAYTDQTLNLYLSIYLKARKYWALGSLLVLIDW